MQNQPNKLSVLLELALQTIDTNDAKEALMAREQIGDYLKSSSIEFRNAFNNEQYELLAHLSWTAIILLPFNAVEEMVKTQLVPVLIDEDLGPKQKLKAWLYSEASLTYRNDYRQKLRQFLLDSNEIVTSVTDQNSFSSVGGWCKNYVSVVGMEPSSQLAIEQYFLNSKQFQKLSDVEKELVRSLINLFEWLKYPSNSAQGFEGTILYSDKDGVGVLSDGIFEKYNDRDFGTLESVRKAMKEFEEQEKKETAPAMPSGKNINESQNKIVELKTMASSFPGGSLERKAIEQEISELEKQK